MITNEKKDFLKNLYYKNAEIPKRYMEEIPLTPKTEEDLKSFNRLKIERENIDEFTKNGKNLLICSPVSGTGKTTWATKILKQYIDNRCEEWKLANNGCPGLFVDMYNLFFLKKSSFNNYETRTRVYDFEKKIRTASLVVFDDICLSGLSDFENSYISDLINYRISNNLSCIFTSNQTREKAEKFLGVRLTDRIYGTSEVINFTDESSNRHV